MSPNLSRLRLAIILAATMLASFAPAEDWPQWRGPRFDGVSTETGLATEWGPGKNIRWRASLPGPAGSTPVVFGDRVFITSTDNDQLLLICFATEGDQAGKELWRREVSRGSKTVRGDEGNYASPSPAVDKNVVVSLMGNGDLACFDHDGNQQWSFDVQDRYGKLDIAFGLTSTPVLHQGRVYLQLIHGEGDPTTHEARVVALNATDGSEVWSQPRITGAKQECEHAYTSPLLYGVGGAATPILLTHGGDYLIAHAIADGRELWRCGGMNRHSNYHPTLRFVASPGIGGGLIVAPTAKKGPVFAINPSSIDAATGADIQGTDNVAWQLSRDTPDVPTPLVHDGLVYLCAENGVLRTFDAANGAPVYRKRLVSDRYRASPVLADGKLYCISRRGVVSVVRAGRDFELLAKNDLGEATSASLAVANGIIYQRTFDALYAIAP